MHSLTKQKNIFSLVTGILVCLLSINVVGSDDKYEILVTVLKTNPQVICELIITKQKENTLCQRDSNASAVLKYGIAYCQNAHGVFEFYSYFKSICAPVPEGEIVFEVQSLNRIEFFKPFWK